MAAGGDPLPEHATGAAASAETSTTACGAEMSETEGFGIALLVMMVEARMRNGESREAAIQRVADNAELRSEAIEKLKNACQTPLENHIGGLGTVQPNGEP
jgi:hypothetical protein